jgi:hypothetical protein
MYAMRTFLVNLLIKNTLKEYLFTLLKTKLVPFFVIGKAQLLLVQEFASPQAERNNLFLSGGE